MLSPGTIVASAVTQRQQSVAEIYNHAVKLKEDYEKSGNVDPERGELLFFLTKALEHLIKLQKVSTEEAMSEKITVAAADLWATCAAIIYFSYDYINPDGTVNVWSTKVKIPRVNGSQVFNDLLAKGNLSLKNFENRIDILEQINRFYQFAFVDPKTGPAFQAMLTDKNVILLFKSREKQSVAAALRTVMQAAVKPLVANLDKELRVIQSETTTDYALENIYKHYKALKAAQHKEVNQQKILLTQIAYAIGKLNPTCLEEKPDPNYLITSNRLKLGILMVINLWDKRRSALARIWNSEPALTKVGKRSLCENFEFMSSELRIECMTLLRRYLKDPKNIAAIEDVINDKALFSDEHRKYLNADLAELNKIIKSMLENMLAKPNQPSSFRIPAQVIMAYMAFCPLAGAGFTIAFGAIKTNGMQWPINQLQDFTSDTMVYIIGDGGRYLGHYGAEVFVTVTTEIAAALLLGGVGALLGAATGMAIVITLEKHCPNALNNLYAMYRHLLGMPQLQPLIKQQTIHEMDPRLFNLLTSLPKEVYPESQRVKLGALAGEKVALGQFFVAASALPTQPKSDEARASVRNLQLDRVAGPVFSKH